MTLLTTCIIFWPQETILGRPSGLQKSLLILGLLVSLWFPPPQPRSHPESWILKMIFTLKFQRRVTMLLQGYMQSEILCFYNKPVLKGFFFCLVFFLECCTVLRKKLKMKVHLHLFCKSLVTGTLLMGNRSPNIQKNPPASSPLPFPNPAHLQQSPTLPFFLIP